MFLEKEEEKILDGEYGEVMEKCMKILVKLGDIYGADKLIDIKSVHSPGASYRVSGDAGLNFVEEVSKKAKFKCSTTLNTGGMDLENWKEHNIPEYFAEKQLRLTRAYEKMGAISCHTCTPYFIGNLPLENEDIAWGESSAICFANSVIGARTNREGGPSALAAGVIGKVPDYGYHRDENRKGDFLFKINTEVKTVREFGALGYYVGKIVGRKVPVFENLKNTTLDNLKALSAALASSGAVSLFLMKKEEDLERIEIDEEDLKEVYEKFGDKGKPDIVCIGCPHASIFEIKEIASILKGKKLDTECYILTSKPIKSLSDRMKYTEIIEKAGGKIVCDTCPILTAKESMNYDLLYTNSAKLAHYAPGVCDIDVSLLELKDCLVVK